MTLKQGDYLGGSNVIIRVLICGRRRQKKSEWENVKRTRPAAAGFEDGRGPQAKKCWRILEARKWQGTRSSYRTSRKEHSPVDKLILSEWDTHHSGLQKCKIINLSCFKPLNLWLVTAEIGNECCFWRNWSVSLKMLNLYS